MKSIFFIILLLFFVDCVKEAEQIKEEVSKTEISKVKSEVLYGLGPDGEKPSTIEELKKSISSISKEDFNDEKYSIVVAMHDVQNDWSQAVISGIKETLKKYGLKITLITDGEFNIEKQLSDYNQIKKLKPNILITLAVDAKKTSSILLEIEKNGTEIIFIDALPEGFIPGKNCIGWAVGDCYTMGKAGAEILAAKVNEGDTICTLNWKNRMFTVDRRSDGVRDMFKKQLKYKVEELEFDGFHEIENLIENAINGRTISGFWAVWDAPAIEILNVLNANNYNSKIVTADLSKEIAMEIAKKNSLVIGTVADDPYSIGEIEAMLAVATLSEIETDNYYVTPVIKVERSNLSEAWKRIYKEALPNDIDSVLNN